MVEFIQATFQVIWLLVPKLFSLLLSMLLGLPAGLLGMAGTPTETHIRSEKPPNVFVSGWLGYGEFVGTNYMIPSFGIWENVLQMLEKEGYECYAADPGGFSSNWDRACTVYAQLTGSRVDFGAAHSEEHGHARYGRTFAKPLVEDWGPDRPVNLLGYSQGGQTIYLLTHLLAQGSARERAATPEKELSPLFAGGKADLVHSVTSLAGTLNGTSIGATYPEGQGFALSALYYLLFAPVMVFGIVGPLSGMYDIYLDQFGLSAPGMSKLIHIPPLGSLTNYLGSRDHSLYDMAPGNAMESNKNIRENKATYYFSYVCDVSEPRGNGTYRMPLSQLSNNFIAYGFGTFMGLPVNQFQGKTYDSPAGPITIDESWYPNDGVVNVVAAAYPFGAPHKEFDANKLERGIWQVMPTLEGRNHMFFCGMDLGVTTDDLYEFYFNHMKVLDSTLKK